MNDRHTRAQARAEPTLGLGCGRLGPPHSEVSAARATIRRALDLGIRYFDTAPLYGAGSSELCLGAALADIPRESFRLSTKVGRRVAVRDDGGPRVFLDFTRTGIRRSLAESLERLDIDRVDIAYMHDPQNDPAAALSAYRELEAMRDEGTVGTIGVGVNQAEYALPFVTRRRVDIILLAGRWTLLDQSAADTLLPECAARGITLVAGGVYNSGILAEPNSSTATFDYRPPPPEIATRARQLDQICQQHDVPLKAAALQFPLGNASVTSVLLGARDADELEENAALFRHHIPDRLWGDLVASGLVKADHVPALPAPDPGYQ